VFFLKCLQVVTFPANSLRLSLPRLALHQSRGERSFSGLDFQRPDYYQAAVWLLHGHQLLLPDNSQALKCGNKSHCTFCEKALGSFTFFESNGKNKFKASN